MKTTSISLEAESERELKKPAKDVRKAIRKRSLVMLLLCTLSVSLAYLGILSLDKERLSEQTPTGILERTVVAPKTALRTIGYATFSVFLFGGGLLALWQLAGLVFPWLHTDELSTDTTKTVKHYYNNISSRSNLHAYQYLLQQAKEEIGGYQGFVEHHNKLRNSVLEDLRGRLDEPAIQDANYSLLKVQETQTTDVDMKHYVVHISIIPLPD